MSHLIQGAHLVKFGIWRDMVYGDLHILLGFFYGSIAKMTPAYELYISLYFVRFFMGRTQSGKRQGGIYLRKGKPLLSFGISQ